MSSSHIIQPKLISWSPISASKSVEECEFLCGVCVCVLYFLLILYCYLKIKNFFKKGKEKIHFYFVVKSFGFSYSKGVHEIILALSYASDRFYINHIWDNEISGRGVSAIAKEIQKTKLSVLNFASNFCNFMNSMEMFLKCFQVQQKNH